MERRQLWSTTTRQCTPVSIRYLLQKHFFLHTHNLSMNKIVKYRHHYPVAVCPEESLCIRPLQTTLYDITEVTLLKLRRYRDYYSASRAPALRSFGVFEAFGVFGVFGVFGPISDHFNSSSKNFQPHSRLKPRLSAFTLYWIVLLSNP